MCFWTFPHNDSKTKATSGHFSLKWTCVSHQRLPVLIQWCFSTAGRHANTYQKQEQMVYWQCDCFATYAKWLPVREWKLLEGSVSHNLQDFQTSCRVRLTSTRKEWTGGEGFSKSSSPSLPLCARSRRPKGVTVSESPFLFYSHSPVSRCLNLTPSWPPFGSLHQKTACPLLLIS